VGASLPHVLGRNQRFYARREATPFTFLRPGITGDATSPASTPTKTANALRVLSSKMSRKQETKVRADARQTRSELETILGKVECSWGVSCYAGPSGSAGLPPDTHELLVNHFGTFATSASTSCTYTPTDSQSARGTLSLMREMNEIASQAIRGGICDVLKISLTGGDEPKFDFEGAGADLVGTGYSTLAAEAAVGASSITVVDADNYRVGSVIGVGTSLNAAGTPPGHIVTTKAGAVLGISPVIVGTQAIGSVVAPYVPTEVVTASPIAGILGSLTLDGTTYEVTQANIEHRNNDKLFKDFAFQPTLTDYVPGYATGSVELMVRARRDQIILLNRIESAIQTIHPVILTCGDTAGRRMVTTMNRIEFNAPEFEVPQAEEGMIKLVGRMLGNTGADHISVVFN
jgi:hypothetical protein